MITALYTPDVVPVLGMSRLTLEDSNAFDARVCVNHWQSLHCQSDLLNRMKRTLNEKKASPGCDSQPNQHPDHSFAEYSLDRSLRRSHCDDILPVFER